MSCFCLFLVTESCCNHLLSSFFIRQIFQNQNLDKKSYFRSIFFNYSSFYTKIISTILLFNGWAFKAALKMCCSTPTIILESENKVLHLSSVDCERLLQKLLPKRGRYVFTNFKAIDDSGSNFFLKLYLWSVIAKFCSCITEWNKNLMWPFFLVQLF